MVHQAFHHLVVSGSHGQTDAALAVLEAFSRGEYYKIPFMISDDTKTLCASVFNTPVIKNGNNGDITMEVATTLRSITDFVIDLSALFELRVYYHIAYHTYHYCSCLVDNGKVLHSRRYDTSVCYRHASAGECSDTDICCEDCAKANPDFQVSTFYENCHKCELPDGTLAGDWISALQKEL